ncbi:ATP-binding cassette domain-containing protein [Plantactinospora veratri]
MLDGIDLRVPPGATIAVVGPSGAGKSTLAAVAGRLRDPDAGEVLLDGVPLRRLSRSALRQAVGYGFERPVLVGETIAEAVMLGDAADAEARLGAVARAAAIDEFVERLPDGYHSRLDATPMSGGEAQRLGLARALHAQRLLILDDATSSLDTATEHRIAAAVAAHPDRRTRLVVTHRVATAAAAELVAWLDGGRLRGVGPHRRLWRDPAYRGSSPPRRRPGPSRRRPGPTRRSHRSGQRNHRSRRSDERRRPVHRRRAAPPVPPTRPARRLVGRRGAADPARRLPDRPGRRRRVPGRPTGHRAGLAGRTGRRGGDRRGRHQPGVRLPRRRRRAVPGRAGRPGGHRGAAPVDRRRSPAGDLGGGPADPSGGDRPGHLRRAGDGGPGLPLHRRGGPARALLADSGGGGGGRGAAGRRSGALRRRAAGDGRPAARLRPRRRAARRGGRRGLHRAPGRGGLRRAGDRRRPGRPAGGPAGPGRARTGPDGGAAQPQSRGRRLAAAGGTAVGRPLVGPAWAQRRRGAGRPGVRRHRSPTGAALAGTGRGRRRTPVRGDPGPDPRRHHDRVRRRHTPNGAADSGRPDAAVSVSRAGSAWAELRGVTFRYGPRARPVLDGFDLTLGEGAYLAVVGPSGAGKSTLAGLLAGLLRPQAGTVLLGGTPTGAADPATLARHRVLIPQEAYVFAGTLLDNLRYLCPDAPADRVDAAVHRLGLLPLVRRLGGLTATVDPTVLSAGERQLVAAVRAYLSPRRWRSWTRRPVISTRWRRRRSKTSSAPARARWWWWRTGSVRRCGPGRC